MKGMMEIDIDKERMERSWDSFVEFWFLESGFDKPKNISMFE